MLSLMFSTITVIFTVLLTGFLIGLIAIWFDQG
jgi:cbb3-type cytochrome oxidase subunit 3